MGTPASLAFAEFSCGSPSPSLYASSLQVPVPVSSPSAAASPLAGHALWAGSGVNPTTAQPRSRRVSERAHLRSLSSVSPGASSPAFSGFFLQSLSSAFAVELSPALGLSLHPLRRRADSSRAASPFDAASSERGSDEDSGENRDECAFSREEGAEEETPGSDQVRGTGGARDTLRFGVDPEQPSERVRQQHESIEDDDAILPAIDLRGDSSAEDVDDEEIENEEGAAAGKRPRSFKEKRREAQRRRTAYLRRGRRYGASAPEIAGKDSERVDQAYIEELAGYLPVEVHRRDNATVLIEADIPGHVTQRVHELTITHLRTTLRVPGYRSGLAEVPLSMLQYYAGGTDAVKQRAIQALGDLLLHQATKKGAKMIGTPQFVEKDTELVAHFTPGKAMKLQIRCDTLPTVKFKENYKGLKLRVPRPPYPKGLLFQKAEEILKKRHAAQVDFPNQDTRRARMGDAVEIEVTRGWFEKSDETRGDAIPTHLIAGNVTVILDKECNPEGGAELVDGLLGIRKGDTREVRVPLPFSVKEMKPFVGAPHVSTTASTPPSRPSPRVSATGFLETEGTAGAREADGAEDLSAVDALAREAGVKCGIDVTDETRQHILDDDEERLVQTTLHVKCLAVKQRVPRELDDEFYKTVCNESREQVRQRLEATGDELVEAASVKARRGAVASALDDITTIDAPNTLIEEQARLTYKQQLLSTEMEGHDITGLDTEEKYQEWKSKNLPVVVKLLKTAFTIKAILKNENLQVDRAKLMQSVEATLMKCPGQKPETVTERTLNLMESQLAYDFVADHAEITYYVEEKPVTASVVHKSADGQISYGMKAYPAGADVDRYQKRRQELVDENEKMKDLTSKFFMEPGGKKRPPPLKPEDGDDES
ncbi:putative trigger factor protein [Besnoitia besnoiti]|uniref:peptidylprolyl isomerase n=1 Tax=Besnoitia besnoiti TaxID=94643 RepID=A0A2A9MFL7_BESBE|nr:putative trigger factor protein [Besnoitia besnoiti]PFH34766.1 putative trigger factor protein [Besnoitia besnoiti]